MSFTESKPACEYPATVSRRTASSFSMASRSPPPNCVSDLRTVIFDSSGESTPPAPVRENSSALSTSAFLIASYWFLNLCTAALSAASSSSSCLTRSKALLAYSASESANRVAMKRITSSDDASSSRGCFLIPALMPSATLSTTSSADRISEFSSPAPLSKKLRKTITELSRA